MQCSFRLCTELTQKMFFESFVLNLAILSILIFALIFDYVTKFFSYWYVRHISYKRPLPFFGSDYHRVLGLRSSTNEVNQLYRKYPTEKFVGYIKSRIPDLIVKDSDALKTVLSTQFENFSSRGLALQKSQDVCLRNNLFYTEGEKWTLLRQDLESLLKKLTWNFDDNNEYLSGINGDINVQVWLSNILDRAFKDLLMDENANSKGRLLLTEIRSQLQSASLLNKIKSYFKTIFPSMYVLFGLFTLPGQPTNRTLEILENSKLMKEINKIPIIPVSGIKEKFNKKPKKNTDTEFAFTVLTMFINEGYLPCFNVLTALFFELAKNPEIQHKARMCVQNCGQEDYLDKVIKEATRLYPPYSILTRKCVKAYKFPGNDLLIDKHVTITVPVEAIQRDSNYYKQPEAFDPDRFSNDDHRTSFVYLPYGAGPKKCLGEELSLQILRSVTRAILRKFEIEPSARTPKHLSIRDHNFGRSIESDVWLKFTPVKINS